jgi:PilZ domain
MLTDCQSFAAKSDVMDMSNTDQMAEAAKRERAKARISMFLSANILFDGETKAIDVRIRNLSPGGMMVDSAKAFNMGHRAKCEIKGIGEIGGEVAWVAAGRIGIKFDSEVDPDAARQSIGKAKLNTGFQPVPPSRRPGLAIR